MSSRLIPPTPIFSSRRAKVIPSPIGAVFVGCICQSCSTTLPLATCRSCPQAMEPEDGGVYCHFWWCGGSSRRSLECSKPATSCTLKLSVCFAPRQRTSISTGPPFYRLEWTMRLSCGASLQTMSWKRLSDRTSTVAENPGGVLSPAFSPFRFSAFSLPLSLSLFLSLLSFSLSLFSSLSLSSASALYLSTSLCTRPETSIATTSTASGGTESWLSPRAVRTALPCGVPQETRGRILKCYTGTMTSRYCRPRNEFAKVLSVV